MSMLIYAPPVADYMFLFRDVFDLEAQKHLRGYADLDLDLLGTVLEEAGRLCVDKFLPLAATADVEGCIRHEDGSVSTPSGFREAYHAYCAGGWAGFACAEEYGGQGFPRTINTALQECTSAANQSLDMYFNWGDNIGAILMAHGTRAQCETYLPKLISGQWSGTMALTEPHCGTDLGLLRTRAVPQPDGSYQITGTKIFNSGGEHDLADNIIHLVLARIEGAPAGTRGISLFVLPKFMPQGAGGANVRNAVSCGSVEHKMGLKGSATCVMHYDAATAWLVGEPNQGLMAMFRMMNLIRRRTGTMAVGISEIATQNAASYARERLQGRAMGGAKYPDRPADPLIVHPDVRRTLMQMRSFNEGARALLVWSGLIADIIDRSPDKAERAAAAERLALVTPVIKAYLSDVAFENTVSAQQIYGGHGYMAETGIERLVRDIRMLAIAEGANGIQGVDLALRKVAADGGRAAEALFAEIDAAVAQATSRAETATLGAAVARALADARAATDEIIRQAGADRDAAACGATDYLALFGLLLIGFMWLKVAAVAADRAAAGDRAEEMADRLARARFYAQRRLPETALRLERIRAEAKPIMELEAAGF
jgi:alkylation response protein AidB-like acyl-CoA dehydrogenase